MDQARHSLRATTAPPHHWQHLHWLWYCYCYCYCYYCTGCVLFFSQLPRCCVDQARHSYRSNRLSRRTTATSVPRVHTPHEETNTHTQTPRKRKRPREMIRTQPVLAHTRRGDEYTRATLQLPLQVTTTATLQLPHNCRTTTATLQLPLQLPQYNISRVTEIVAAYTETPTSRHLHLVARKSPGRRRKGHDLGNAYCILTPRKRTGTCHRVTGQR